MALSDGQRKQLHQQLLKKGSEINERLVELLSGQPAATEGVVLLAKPGERPEERLRRFLDLVDRKVQESRDGSHGYGLCESCGATIPFPELEQMPWAERCLACAEKDGSQ